MSNKRIKRDTGNPEISSEGANPKFADLLESHEDLKIAYDALRNQLLAFGIDFNQVYSDLRVHKELARVSALKDNLFNMIVHDLKNPLGSMNLLLQVMGDPPDASILDTAHWELLRNQNSSALEMCEQLLDITKIESDQLELNLTQAKISNSVAESLLPFQLQAKNDGIEISVEVPDVTLETDHTLLKRVLMNLLNNALKYSPKNERISLYGHMTEQYFHLSVSDTGPGIPESYQEKIFELFASAEIRSEVRGTGIGLAFCKLVMKALGGSIAVESVAGFGSTFNLSIPNSNS